MRNLRRTLAGLAVWMGSTAAHGQVYQVQGGNVLDANRQVGSGGVNPVARSYDFNAGNRIVSGNVAGGKSFQGYSPIRDPSQLFLGTRSYNSGTTFGSSTYSSRLGTGGSLPSAGMSGFQGGSYSVSDQQTGTLTWYNRGVPVTSAALPYYSPANTVASTGAIIAGVNRPGTSQLLNPYAAPSGGGGGSSVTDARLAAGAGRSGDGTSLWQGPRLVRAETGASVSGPVNGQLLQSNLFAPAFRVVTPVQLARIGQSDPVVARQINLPPAPQALVGSQAPERLPVDLRTDRYQPGDSRLDTRVHPLVGGAGTDPTAGPGAALLRGPGVPADQPPDQDAGVFADMRRIAAGAQPGAFAPPGADAEVDPSLRPAQTPVQIRPPGAAGDGALSGQVLKTFVGSEASVANRYLASAEDALHQGEYYHAGTLYKMASSVDPTNPLPYLGRSLALLSAGDYVTSANDLFAAIQLFDSLSLFKLDLKSFLPDLKVLDSRRADMETRLATAEDYRLRFLLGYAEYLSGVSDVGLKNMEKALATAPMVLGYTYAPDANPRMATSPQVKLGHARLESLQKQYEQNRWRLSRQERKEAREQIDKAEEESAAVSRAFGEDKASPFSNIQMIRIEPVRRFVEALDKQVKGVITPAPAPPAPRNQPTR